MTPYPEQFQNWTPKERLEWLNDGANPDTLNKYQNWIKENAEVFYCLKTLLQRWYIMGGRHDKYPHTTIREGLRINYEISLPKKFLPLIIRHYIAYHPRYKDRFNIKPLSQDQSVKWKKYEAMVGQQIHYACTTNSSGSWNGSWKPTTGSVTYP